MIKDYLNSIIHFDGGVDDFNLILSNSLNYLWAFSEDEYQEFVYVKPDIDFDSYRHIENTCKLFAIVRYVARARGFFLKFNDVYFDKRLYLKEPYYGEYATGKDCVRMLTNSPQPFYDYNAFYYPHSLHIM